jgi:rod shape determining protein RodA
VTRILLVRIDWATLTVTLALIGLGILMLQTTSNPNAHGLENRAVQQAILAGIGLVLAISMSQIDYRFLKELATPIYLGGLLALFLVLFLGDASLGALRWFDLGPIVVQPSEIMKIAAIVFFAKYLSERQGSIRSLRSVLASLGTVLFPVSLILLEPDLGTAVIFLCIWLAMIFVAGARIWHLLLPIGIGLAAFPFGWFFAQDYMRQRFVMFFNPSSDPLGAGYNVLQAQISIGSGGYFGQGIGQGTQSKLEFLRVRDTDFIFAMLGEQLGLVGTLGLVLFFALLITQAIFIALRARDTFGQLLSIGVAAMLFTQSFINIGMNVGLMPVTGITLPLVSFGKNSLLVTLIGIGFLLSVHTHRTSAPFRQQSVQFVSGALASVRSRVGPRK